MDRPQVSIGSLFDGVGMLDEGVRAGLDILGFDARTVLRCEWETFATSVVLERMEAKALEPCPIWCADIAELDGSPWRGRVDCLIASPPCQPYSVAGKQLGNDDDRSHGEGNGPIVQWLRLVEEIRPVIVFAENVSPWIRGGHFRTCRERLLDLGYEVPPAIFVSAEDVGASHRRERAFVLAYDPLLLWGAFQRCESDGDSGEVAEPESGGQRELRKPPASDGQSHGRELAMGDAERSEQGNRDGQNEEGRIRRDRPAEPSFYLGDSEREGLQERRVSDGIGERASALGAGDSVADSNGSGRRKQGNPSVESRPHTASEQLADSDDSAGRTDETERRQVWGDADRRAGQGSLFAPGPNSEQWRTVEPHLSPAVEPGVQLVADGRAVVVDLYRPAQLRCAGNSVVPLQAAVAFVELMRRSNIGG